MLHKLRRLFALSRHERRLLARAFFSIAVASLRLRQRDYFGLSKLDGVKGAAQSLTAAEAVGRARLYSRYIELASRHHLVPTHCFHRSLVLHHWLRQEGIASALRIGVRKNAGGLAAHAWVEVNGQVVNDRVEAIQAFVPLVRAGRRCLDSPDPTSGEAGPFLESVPARDLRRRASA